MMQIFDRQFFLYHIAIPSNIHNNKKLRVRLAPSQKYLKEPSRFIIQNWLRNKISVCFIFFEKHLIKMRLIFAIFGFNRAQTPASEGIELSREFSWSWDIENVCIKRTIRLTIKSIQIFPLLFALFKNFVTIQFSLRFNKRY